MYCLYVFDFIYVPFIVNVSPVVEGLKEIFEEKLMNLQK